MAIRKASKITRTTVGKAPAKKAVPSTKAKKQAPARKSASKAATGKPIKKAVVKKSTPSTAPAKKAGKTAAVRKVAVKKVTSAKKTASKQIAKKVVAGKTPAKKASVKRIVASNKAVPAKPVSKARAGAAAKKISQAGTPVKSRARKPTPRQALAVTRKLLEEKTAHDREPQPWQLLDAHAMHVADALIQSNEALEKANELHAAESRMKAIQGSMGTQDRRSQGKRDNR